jgi:hypothetical protein
MNRLSTCNLAAAPSLALPGNRMRIDAPTSGSRLRDQALSPNCLCPRIQAETPRNSVSLLVLSHRTEFNGSLDRYLGGGKLVAGIGSQNGERLHDPAKQSFRPSHVSGGPGRWQAGCRRPVRRAEFDAVRGAAPNSPNQRHLPESDLHGREANGSGDLYSTRCETASWGPLLKWPAHS